MIIVFNNDSYEFIKHFRHASQCCYRYMSDYYKKEMLLTAWFGPIFHVFHLDDWDVPNSITSIVVNPLVIQTPRSQPKIKRISFAGERRRRRDQVCSICRQLGHN